MLPVYQSEKQRERDGERQGEENVQRVDQALELRRQDHVHEDHGQQEDPEELDERLLELSGPARDGRDVAGGQVHLRGRLLERVHPVGLAVAGRDDAAEPVLALALRPVDARRRLVARDLDEVVQPDEPAAGRHADLRRRAERGRRARRAARDVEPRDRGRVAPVRRAQAELDVVVLVERRDRGSARPPGPRPPSGGGRWRSARRRPGGRPPAPDRPVPAARAGRGGASW